MFCKSISPPHIIITHRGGVLGREEALGRLRRNQEVLLTGISLEGREKCICSGSLVDSSWGLSYPSPCWNMWNLPQWSGAMPPSLGEEISCQAPDGYSHQHPGSRPPHRSLSHPISNSSSIPVNGTTKICHNSASCHPYRGPHSISGT